MTGDATIVRRDLLAGYRLLERLGELITVQDFSDAHMGAPVVIAAPHQASSGTPLSRGHDVHTGVVAERLSRALHAKCVIADELRTFVDLNKDPSGAKQEASLRHLGRLAFREADRRLKLYYQSQLFASNPGTVIEIHGHARGVFDVEVSTGFELDERVEHDRHLLAALKAFEAALVQALSDSPAFGHEPPTVGVYPLNRAVRFTAKGTHTFNKVERLRQLGVNVGGLHIELRKSLRPDPELATSDAHYRALIDCLARAIQAFRKVSERVTAFDTQEPSGLGGPSTSRDHSVLPLSGCALKVCPVPKDIVGLEVMTLSARDLTRLGIEEGAQLVVGSDASFQNHVKLQAATGSKLRDGCLGLAKRFREQLGLEPGDDVFVGTHAKVSGPNLTLGFVAIVRDDLGRASAEVGRKLAETLRDHGTSLLTDLTLNSASVGGQPVSVSETDALPHERAISLSRELASELHVTYGDLIYFASAP